VFCGDTLCAESEVLEVRASKSRPTQGIVTTRTRGLNHDGVQVMEFIRMSLIPKRGHGVGD
jgi:acyl dehydratase